MFHMIFFFLHVLLDIFVGVSLQHWKPSLDVWLQPFVFLHFCAALTVLHKNVSHSIFFLFCFSAEQVHLDKSTQYAQLTTCICLKCAVVVVVYLFHSRDA